jgi:tetratricopeptide (TPR) repeat protein
LRFSFAYLRPRLTALLVATLAACSGPGPEKPAPGTAFDLSKQEAINSPGALKRARFRIDSLETEIRKAVKSPTKAPDIRLAMYTIQAYQYFAADFPQDARAPEGLDRAGQLWSGVLGDHQKAVEYYEKAYKLYPAYKNRPQLLLQMGLACEAGKDTASAANAYQRLMGGYPEHPLASQARGLLKVMRMSEAERQRTFK